MLGLAWLAPPATRLFPNVVKDPLRRVSRGHNLVLQGYPERDQVPSAVPSRTHCDLPADLLLWMEHRPTGETRAWWHYPPLPAPLLASDRGHWPAIPTMWSPRLGGHSGVPKVTPKDPFTLPLLSLWLGHFCPMTLPFSPPLTSLSPRRSPCFSDGTTESGGSDLPTGCPKCSPWTAISRSPGHTNL